jgi:hypothetical protein
MYANPYSPIVPSVLILVPRYLQSVNVSTAYLQHHFIQMGLQMNGKSKLITVSVTTELFTKVLDVK